MGEVFAVIMAGGVGSRFWPLSRERRPKQFLDILGTGKSLLQQTYDRLSRIAKPENILIVTKDDYFSLVKEQLPQIPEQNILAEPLRRNTAPCITYAAMFISKKDPDGIMIVSPADHYVGDVSEFVNTLKTAVSFVKEEKTDALVTLGIEPSRPETGYGYIQLDANEKYQLGEKVVYKVKTFTEKPDVETAKIFVESGEFLWNSGIFVWSASTILKSIREYLPEIYDEFERNKDKIGTDKEGKVIMEIYEKVPAISIDYGVMEKEKSVFVLPANFGWSDLGTWGSLYENYPKDENDNVIQGNNVLTFDTHRSFISVPDDKLVVVLGLENIIVAESDGMLLVANRDFEQQIRNIVNMIKMEKGNDYV